MLDTEFLSKQLNLMRVQTNIVGMSVAPGFKGIKAQTQLDYRYYNEDTGFGLVLWTDMADKLGLEVPNMRAMLQIVSAIMGRNYKAEKARTLDTLGLDGLYYGGAYQNSLS